MLACLRVLSSKFYIQWTTIYNYNISKYNFEISDKCLLVDPNEVISFPLSLFRTCNRDMQFHPYTIS